MEDELARGYAIRCRESGRPTGPRELAGNPMKLTSFADPPTRPAVPDLDADRDHILRELAGIRFRAFRSGENPGRA
jgi:hypothetical protein